MNFDKLYSKVEILEEARTSSVWLPGWQNMLVNTRKFQTMLQQKEGLKFPTPINALAKYALATIDGVTSGNIDADSSEIEIGNELKDQVEKDQVEQEKGTGLPYTQLINKLKKITDPKVKEEINKVWTAAISADNPIEFWAMREISFSNRKLSDDQYQSQVSDKIDHLRGLISQTFLGGNVEAMQKAKEEEKLAKKGGGDTLDPGKIQKGEEAIYDEMEKAMGDEEIWRGSLVGTIEEKLINWIEGVEKQAKAEPKKLEGIRKFRAFLIKNLGQAKSYIEFKDLLDNQQTPFGKTDEKGTILSKIWRSYVEPVFMQAMAAGVMDIIKAPASKARETRSGVDLGGSKVLTGGRESGYGSEQALNNPLGGEEQEEELVKESKKPVVKYIANKDIKAKTYWQKMAQQEMYYR